LHNSFTAGNGTSWGVFDASSLVAGLDAYIDYNGNDASWVANISDTFRRAGGTGALSTLPDAAIAASLKAAGLWGMRQSVTFENPIAYGFPPTTGYADDPVNTASGNFVELENDLPFGALVAGLRFTRIYNSRSDRTGPFGPGWASWATARLRARPEGAEYEGADGQRAVIPRMGTGYGRLAGIDGLVEATESGLALRWFGGGSWHFDQAGLPTRTERGPGTEIHFHHEDGRLVEMKHEGGKRITLEWSNDRIVALVSSDGRRVDYRYDDHRNLVEVVSDAGARRYDLDEAGRIVRVIDADGAVEVTNTYDEEGRVLGQVSRFGRHTQYSYLPGRVTVNQDDSEGPINTYIHDHAGRLVGLVDGHGNKLSKSYDDWGNPVAITERNGATTVREWDQRSRCVRETRPGGEWFAFDYDETDRVVRVTASTGAVTTYRYEGEERSPVEMVDPEGGVTRMRVEGGLVRAVTDPDGVELRFEFDPDGNLVRAVDGDGNTAGIEHDAAGRALAAVTPTGRRTEFDYDPRGRLVQRNDPGGATWAFEYSNAGRLTAVVDPLGARLETRYGLHGEIEDTVDPLGHVSSRRYDEMGNLVGVTAPDGAKWEHTYDGLCRLSSTQDPAGATWLREYDATGNLIATIDPIGTRQSANVDPSGRVVGLDDGVTSATFELDELGRTVLRRRLDGTEMRATFDLCGRRTSVTDPNGGTTRYEYTPGGRLSRMVSPLGRTLTLEYNRCGRLAARIDGGGRRWTYHYAADGALLEVVSPGGGHDRFEYDEAGRLSRRTAPGSGRTTYSYDLAGRVVAIAAPHTGTRRFSYDAAGRMVEATDGNGGVTRFTYNERGWITQVQDALGGRVTREHDEVGRLVCETDQLRRRTRFVYDPAGRLIEKIDGNGATTRLSYDASGRLFSFGSDQGAEVTVERDVLGRAITVEEGGLRHELHRDSGDRLVERRRNDVSVRWRYDADGYREALTHPDGTETTYAYDASGNVSALRHPALGSLEVERDGDGRLVSLSGQGVQARWSYQAGSLVGYQLQTGDVVRETQLTRDSDGRITSSTINGVVTAFSYDPAGQLIGAHAPGDSTRFLYDANGRLIEERSPDGRVSYVYDAAGQLSERRRTTSTTHYGYDGAGRRISETDNERTKTYTWDELGRLVSVHTRPDEIDREVRLVVDALGELAAVNDTTLMWDTADPFSPLCAIDEDPVVSLGSPWAIVSGGAARWLQPDALGTICEADVWGHGASSSADDVQFGYRGELSFDGLLWLRHRAYDPSTRVFLSPDPLPASLGVAWASNPYSYAGNDPVGSLDPLGLHPVTEAELANYREAMNRSVWERAGDLVQDNWEYIAAGAMIFAGAAVMVTGVGGPLGALMISSALVGAGASAGSQKLITGEVDWGEVAVTGALAGATMGAARIGGALRVGYMLGAGSDASIQLLSTGQIDLGNVLISGIAGGAGGVLGARVSQLPRVASAADDLVAQGNFGMGRILPHVVSGGVGGFGSGVVGEQMRLTFQGDPFEPDKVAFGTVSGAGAGLAGGTFPVMDEFFNGAVGAQAQQLQMATRAAGSLWRASAIEMAGHGYGPPTLWPAAPAIP
jgi:RHS repeat-associated protein